MSWREKESWLGKADKTFRKTNDERSKDRSNSSSRSSNSNSSSSSSDELGSSVNVPADGAGLEAPQCELGEGALWHHSAAALDQEKTKTVNFHLQNQCHEI